MNDIINFVYLLVRLALGFFVFIPLFFLIWLFDSLNSKGQYKDIVNDLKSFLNWLWPGIV